MRDYLGEFLPVIGAAALVTLLTPPFFRWLSFRVGAVVAPDERRVHTKPTALLGGAAILVGFLSGMFVGRVWTRRSSGACTAPTRNESRRKRGVLSRVTSAAAAMTGR